MKNTPSGKPHPLTQEPTFLYPLIALALIVIAVASYLGFQKMLERQAWVEHTNQVIHTCEEMLSSLRDAEMGAKGYVISGKQRYLKSFSGSLHTADTCLRHLRELTRDNAGQQGQLLRLRELARFNAALNRQVVAAKKGGDEGFLRQFYAELRGRLSMDRVEQQTRSMMREEQRLLALRNGQLDQSIRFTRYALYLGVLASLLIAFILHRQRLAKRAHEQELRENSNQLAAFNEELRSNNEELDQARTQLLGFNAQLEGRVAERTRSLEEANGQINRLLDRERQDRQAIEENARRLRLMTDALPVSIVYVDAGIHYRFANRTAREWRRGKAEDMLNRRVEDVVGPATFQTVRAEVERALSGELVRFERQIDYPTGTRHTDSQYVPDIQEGEVRGFYALVMDVTEQVSARREAEQQRQRLHALFMDAPAAICILNGPSLAFELVNPSYQRLFPGRELMGKPLLEALPEIIGQPIQGFLENVYRTGETFHGREVPVGLSRHGQDQPLELHFNFIYQARHDPQGRVDGILVFAYEVSELVQSRRKAEESARRFQALSESVPQIIWTATPDGNLDYFSRQWWEYSGLTLQQSVGQGWASAVHPDDLPGVVEQWSLAQLTGLPYQAEARIRRADGYYRWMLIRALALVDASGSTSQWIGTCTDLQDQKEAEQNLQALTEELAAANEEVMANNDALTNANEDLEQTNRQLVSINADLDNFIYTASHDLKAPIANIEGLVRVLDKKLGQLASTDELVSGVLKMMNHAIARFKETIGDLTEIAKLQKQGQEEQAWVNLPELVGDIRQDLAEPIRESAAQVFVDLDSCPQILFSRKNLKSIVYNLLSNAIKYRSPDRVPQITLSCREEESFAVLSVKDNGLGVAPQDRDKVFGMFKRLHNHVEGTGIGLYIVKKMMDNAEGRIVLESQVGVGSTFKVYFRK
jgi:PAS domain S-box-containing protein